MTLSLSHWISNKCKDLESWLQRNNIRMVGVPKDIVINTTVVATSLKEAGRNAIGFFSCSCSVTSLLEET